MESMEYMLMVNGEPMYKGENHTFSRLDAVRNYARSLGMEEKSEIVKVLPLEQSVVDEQSLGRGFVVEYVDGDGRRQFFDFAQKFQRAVDVTLRCDVEMEIRKLVALNTACFLKKGKRQTTTLSPSP